MKVEWSERAFHTRNRRNLGSRIKRLHRKLLVDRTRQQFHIFLTKETTQAARKNHSGKTHCSGQVATRNRGALSLPASGRCYTCKRRDSPFYDGRRTQQGRLLKLPEFVNWNFPPQRSNSEIISRTWKFTYRQRNLLNNLNQKKLPV